MTKKILLNTRVKKHTKEAKDLWVNQREATRRLTIDLPVSIHRDLKSAAFDREIPMRVLITQLIKEYL